MGKKENLMRELHLFKSNLDKDFPVKKIILFGSVATGKAHGDSDVDLIIVSDKFEKINSIKRASLMYNYWTLMMPVDFLCYTQKEFDKMKNRVTIVKEAVLHGLEIN